MPVHTSPSLTREPPFLVSETFCEKKFFMCGPPTFERPTRIAILSMPTRTKMRRTKYSISIAFLEMVLGESAVYTSPSLTREPPFLVSETFL